MKIVKKTLMVVLIIGLILGCASCMKSCYEYTTYENTVEYRLQELDDGVYGYYNAVTSNIPAENYEMIVLCFGGSVHTLKGNVNIHYVNDDYRLVWTDVNIVHGDIFDVYVPYGSIDMRPNLVQS